MHHILSNKILAQQTSGWVRTQGTIWETSQKKWMNYVLSKNQSYCIVVMITISVFILKYSNSIWCHWMSVANRALGDNVYFVYSRKILFMLVSFLKHFYMHHILVLFNTKFPGICSSLIWLKYLYWTKLCYIKCQFLVWFFNTDNCLYINKDHYVVKPVKKIRRFIYFESVSKGGWGGQDLNAQRALTVSVS